MLLAKTLRSSTLRLALLAIAVFGAAVVALFGYVYWSTASFVRSRADGAIAAEQAVLLQAYERAGRSGLIAAIDEHIAQNRLAGGRYLLVEPAGAAVAGNLPAWPSALTGCRICWAKSTIWPSSPSESPASRGRWSRPSRACSGS